MRQAAPPQPRRGGNQPPTRHRPGTASSGGPVWRRCCIRAGAARSVPPGGSSSLRRRCSGSVASSWRGPWWPAAGGVTVPDWPGEGASCRARVSCMPSRRWSGLLRGMLPVCLPSGRLITRPPLLRARVRAPRPWRGGCWPQHATASVPRRAEPARTARWAARHGRTEYPPPAMRARCRRGVAGHVPSGPNLVSTPQSSSATRRRPARASMFAPHAKLAILDNRPLPGPGLVTPITQFGAAYSPPVGPWPAGAVRCWCPCWRRSLGPPRQFR
jgi:hypothetical protein